MEVQLTRIDDRLVHGQVATVWVKMFKIDRILVVSREVTENPIRKTMLQQAAPPGVKIHVITPEKLSEIFYHPLFLNVRVMLLFTNPKEIVQVIQSGVVLTSVNIGGMSYSYGKKMITNAVAVDRDDLTAFRYLASKGIELEIRKVISDSKQDLIELINKKHL